MRQWRHRGKSISLGLQETAEFNQCGFRFVHCLELRWNMHMDNGWRRESGFAESKVAKHVRQFVCRAIASFHLKSAVRPGLFYFASESASPPFSLRFAQAGCHMIKLRQAGDSPHR
jgi:hypothetical protein